VDGTKTTDNYLLTQCNVGGHFGSEIYQAYSG